MLKRERLHEEVFSLKKTFHSSVCDSQKFRDLLKARLHIFRNKFLQQFQHLCVV